jgi:hypothetical protein
MITNCVVELISVIIVNRNVQAHHQREGALENMAP